MANALVIKKWVANTVADSDGNLVHIEARPAGIVAWAMDMLGMGVTSRLLVSDRTVTYENSSWTGHANVTFTTDKITGVVHGTSKPFREALVLGFALGVRTFGVGAIIGVIYYLMSKSLTVGVMVGNIEYSIPYKKTTVDGVELGKEQAAQVAAIILSRMGAVA